MLNVWFQKGGPYLAIYLWAFMFVLSLVMMTVYPILIAPLFNKFTPVSNQNSCYFADVSLWLLMFSLIFPYVIIFCDANSFRRVSSGLKLKNLLHPSSFHWKSCLWLMDPQDQVIAMWVPTALHFIGLFCM